MAEYIFVVGGSGKNVETGRSILSRRLSEGVWPLNSRTSHQLDLAANDRVLFYVAQKGDSERGHIIAKGQIAGGRVRSRRIDSTPSWLGFAPRSLFDVLIADIAFLEHSIPLKPLVQRLAFVKNKKRWGTALQGGVRRIELVDYNIILRLG